MTTVKPSAAAPQVVELSPSYLLPFGLILGAIPLALVQRWMGLAIALFGLFLLLQTATLRLQFTDKALDIYRSGRLIRRFPYSDWQNWRIFWQPLPILFYFKEVKSIHFLPILFDPQMLETCLQPLPRK